MLFQETINEPHISQILCGDKTETRRTSKRWVMKVWNIYPVHNASKGLFQKKADAVCFIKCTSRWEEKLKDLTKESACHEGLYTIKEFYKIWEVINKKLDLDEKLKHINLYL